MKKVVKFFGWFFGRLLELERERGKDPRDLEDGFSPFLWRRAEIAVVL